VLHLDVTGPDTPRLPRRRWSVLSEFGASAALHASVLSLVASLGLTRAVTNAAVQPHGDRAAIDVSRIVFLAPRDSRIGGGGGGGGDRQPGPIRRSQGVGTDTMTLRARKPAPAVTPVTPVTAPVEQVSPLPSLVLEAKPLALGTVEQLGLPDAGNLTGTSTGRGSGGGVGTGAGTGIGSGRGAGLGPGSGGGFGGGAYRPGGAVTAPRLILEVRPKYTSDALLRRIQGTVTLEAIVTADGCATQIRIVRSLDPGGLDEAAVAAVGLWRFEPGRLAGVPVDVLVTVLLDFTIR